MAEAARRRRVEARAVALLEQSGFAEVILPIIDYAGTDGADHRETYRFVDREGDLVAIRSDFTPMVARALAPELDGTALPLRVFYRGDVVRCSASRLGAGGEMFQIGAEIVGDGSVAADIEVLRLVRSLLIALGVSPRIVFTDNSLPERLGRDVRGALGSKSSTAIAALESRMTRDAFEVTSRLATGTATLDDLKGYEAGDRLAAIERACGPECTMRLDDIDERPGYYTGLRFRAYAGNSRRVIAQGGRYDELYGRFGRSVPAVGFTLTVDDLN